ncbi:MAG TPA: hypothetical protein VGR16_00975 [Thermomicrobiales bacterium]|nr:hypothetical protein [Thermomicrobiales bacterium]
MPAYQSVDRPVTPATAGVRADRAIPNIGGAPRSPAASARCDGQLGMLRLLVGVLLAAAALLLSGGATAYEVWAADDPVVSVEGRLVDIQVQMPLDHLLQMRATTLTVIIPQNATGTVVVDDVSAFPMVTTIVARGPKWDGVGGLPVTVVVEVTAATNYPIRLAATSLTASAVAEGTANVPLRLPLVLE